MTDNQQDRFMAALTRAMLRLQQTQQAAFEQPTDTESLRDLLLFVADHMDAANNVLDDCETEDEE